MLAEIAERYPQLVRIARANLRVREKQNVNGKEPGNCEPQTRANMDINELNGFLDQLQTQESIGTQQEQAHGQEEARQVSQIIDSLLQQLGQSCPGLQITVGSFSNTEQKQEYAANAGMGMHLVIASEYLAWMAAGADQFAQGADKIMSVVETLKQRTLAAANQPGKLLVNSGAVLDEKGNSSYWVATGESPKPDAQGTEKEAVDLGELYRKVAERKISALQKMIPKTKVFPVNPGRQAARLAQFDTVEMARSVAGNVSAGIMILRNSGSQYEQGQVRSTLKQMERILGMAYSKIRHLENEAVVKSSKKKAEQKRQIQQAERRKLELKRMQAKRRAKEYGLARMSTPIAPLLIERKKDEEERREEEQAMAEFAMDLAMSAPVAMDAAPVATMECAVAGMEGVAFSDVAVTEVCISGSVDAVA